MTFDEFQKGTLRSINTALNREQRLAMLCLGLAGEAGEAVDHFKKALFHSHPLNLEKVAKEFGDVLYYLSALAETLGLSMERIAVDNYEKLVKRYPDGFSAERSLNRPKE
jgi:NTP pyrophosphatase (non-canonical NTP hydrolase)